MAATVACRDMYTPATSVASVDEIREIEDRALRAWPAIETVDYDGWLLRFADGYTRRANSVNPHHPSILPIAEKLERCEREYRLRGIQPRFRLTPAAHPEGLDRTLEAAGYVAEIPTAVYQMPLAGSWESSGPGEVRISQERSTSWEDAKLAFSAIPPHHHEQLRGIYDRIEPELGYATVSVESEVVAVGAAVVDSGFVGLFGLVTADRHRRNGYGSQLVKRLLAWGAERGASSAYLQVYVPDSPDAVRMYERLGFLWRYDYWYRVPGQELSSPSSP